MTGKTEQQNEGWSAGPRGQAPAPTAPPRNSKQTPSSSNSPNVRYLFQTSHYLALNPFCSAPLSFVRTAIPSSPEQARMSSPLPRERLQSPLQYDNRFPPPPSPSGHGFATIRPTVLLLAKTLLIPLASAAPLALFRRHAALFSAAPEEPPKSAADPDLYLYLGVAVALVLLGGVFAGLTIALMGQDETYLQVIATSGEGGERKHATKVLNLLKRGKHWVLVTLLLSNVITNETLPIVLDRSLGGGWPAVLSSTVLIGRSCWRSWRYSERNER